MDKKQYYINLLKPYTNKLLSSKEISRATGLKQKHVQKLLKKYDLPRQKQGDSAKGKRNHFWKGGKVVDKSGYILVKMNNHPFCNALGYVREHRLIMENKLKRYLLPIEVVHHKNGIKNDNRIENLELFSKNSEHLKKELKEKIPRWSDSGKKNILKAARQCRCSGVSSNRCKYKNDDQQ